MARLDDGTARMFTYSRILPPGVRQLTNDRGGRVAFSFFDIASGVGTLP